MNGKQKCHEYAYMVKVKWHELWWQQYITSLLQQDVRHIKQGSFLFQSVYQSAFQGTKFLTFDIWGQRISPISLFLKMGMSGCQKTTVRNCHYQQNNSEESSSHLIRSGSLKSHTHNITLHKISMSYLWTAENEYWNAHLL